MWHTGAGFGSVLAHVGGGGGLPLHQMYGLLTLSATRGRGLLIAHNVCMLSHLGRTPPPFPLAPFRTLFKRGVFVLVARATTNAYDVCMSITCCPGDASRGMHIPGHLCPPPRGRNWIIRMYGKPQTKNLNFLVHQQTSAAPELGTVGPMVSINFKSLKILVQQTENQIVVSQSKNKSSKKTQKNTNPIGTSHPGRNPPPPKPPQPPFKTHQNGLLAPRCAEKTPKKQVFLDQPVNPSATLVTGV